jgi:hypothetical protein
LLGSRELIICPSLNDSVPQCCYYGSLLFAHDSDYRSWWGLRRCWWWRRWWRWGLRWRWWRWRRWGLHRCWWWCWCWGALGSRYPEAPTRGRRGPRRVRCPAIGRLPSWGRRGPPRRRAEDFGRGRSFTSHLDQPLDVDGNGSERSVPSQ